MSEDIDNKIKQALIKMHVYERSFNQVSFVHTKEILQMIFELAPIDEKELISMLKISIGVDKRYIRDYLDGFRFWGVIFRYEGRIYSEKQAVLEIQENKITVIESKEKIKICPKNSNKQMDKSCTIELCKTCEGHNENEPKKMEKSP